MHILQPKHTKLNEKESEELLLKLNIDKSQFPKILSSDPALPEGCVIGDIIKIERDKKLENFSPLKSSEKSKEDSKENKFNIYYRVVV